MRVLDKTDKNISIELTHEQALMIVALIREACFGTIMHGFEVRVGHSPEKVGEIGKELHKILESVDISE